MKELTPEIKQALLAPFQAAEVRVRTQPYVAAYATARVVMTRLDEVIPWQWSFKLIGPGVLDTHGVMHQDGVLVIRHPDGALNEFHDRGSAPPDLAKGQAKQAKHAVSDCFKRCAVHAGVGRYLYEITGVQSGRIGKSGLEKALAAVGYHGPWDDRHHGSIGGIREADMEDEEGEASEPSPDPPSRPSAPAPAAQPAQAQAKASAPKLSDAANDPLAGLRTTYSQLGKELFPDSPNACKEYVFDKIGTLTAANLPDAVDALRSLKKQREQPGGLV